MVYFIHQHDDRLGVRHRRLRSVRGGRGRQEQVLRHHLADESRDWRRLPPGFVRAASEAERTRGVLPKLDEECAHALQVGPQVLRLPSIHRQRHLVRL